MTTSATSTSWLRNRIVAAGAALLAGAALAPAVLTPAAWATEPTDQEIYETEEPAVVAEPSVRVAVSGLSYNPEADERLLGTINAKRITTDVQPVAEPTYSEVDGSSEDQSDGGENPESAENPEDTTATPELAWSTTLARAAQERAAMCVLASGTDALSNALVAGTELSAGEQGTMKVSAVLVASATAADDDAEGATANDLVAGMLEELLAPSDDGTASALLDEADKTAGIATLTAGDTTYLVIVLSEGESEVKDAVHCYTADETPTVAVPVAVASPRLTLKVDVAPTSSEEGFPALGSTLAGNIQVLLDGTPVQLVDGVTWTSSDERVLSVENSVFTVQGSGTVTLTASSDGVTLRSDVYTFDLVGPMAIDDDYDDEQTGEGEDGNGNNGENSEQPSDENQAVTYYSTQSVFYALRAEDGSYPAPSTELNAAPENGERVTVTSIIWDDPEPNAAGSYTLTGTGNLDDGTTIQVAQYVQRLDSLDLNPTAWSLTGSDENAVWPTALTGTYGDATVQVDVTWPELATQADGVSFQIEGLAANNATATFTVYVAAFTGAAPTVAADQNGTDLPQTVQATYTDPADGSEHTIDLGLAWNTDGVDFAAAVGGTVTVPATVTFPNGQTAQTSFEVSVEAAEEPAPTITAIAACDPITVELPATPELPGEVGVTYSDDTTATLPVTWDVDGVDFTVAGQYSVSGTVEGAGDLRASVSVTVNEAVPVIVQKATVQVSTPLGTAPVLPQTVEVTWSNGTVEDLAVTWNDGQELDAALYNTAQSFSVAGVLADDEHTAVTATVVVASPTSVQAPAPVTTDAGVAPQLPGSVVVVYSDGSTYEAAVSWDAVDASQYHTGGQFSVTGRAGDTGLSTQVTVNVNDATVTGVQNNLAVQTVVLTAPQLPETASVRWSNGDTTSEAVAWNAVDPSSYAQVGTFTATGTVAGHQVSCTVTVTAAQSETPKTGDTTSIVPIVVGAVAGVAIVAAAIALIVRSRKKR
jgi:LPXTG-motif cell wall-anchored protein